MAHRYDPWSCVEFLFIIHKKIGPIYAGKQVSETQILQNPPPKSNGKKIVINTMCKNGTMSNQRSKYFRNLQPEKCFVHHLKKTGSVFSGILP